VRSPYCRPLACNARYDQDVPDWAIAVRRTNGDLRLFWRVRRSPQGHIYQVFAAGLGYPRILGGAYDPHTSWHLDGRFHTKGHGRVWHRQRRQRLNAFVGAEPFISTSVDQMAAPGLPECNPAGFEGTMEVSLQVIDITPGRQQLHMDLVAAGQQPPAHGLGERPIVRWLLQDREPWIVITLYELFGGDAALM
jgi:hypothetical protein